MKGFKETLELAAKMVRASEQIAANDTGLAAGAAAVGVAGAHMVAASIATLPSTDQLQALEYLMSIVTDVMKELEETQVDDLVRRFKGEKDE